MQRILRDLHTELDRVELLVAALDAFSTPVPEYEPVFRHLAPPARELRQHELHHRQLRRDAPSKPQI